MSNFFGSTKTTTTKTTTRVVAANRFSLSVGINDYPGTGNDLRGCVNDARLWEEILRTIFGFQTKLLIDSQAKVISFTDILNSYVSSAKEGDSIAITYSGHGSNVEDVSGDEADARDEALVLYDGFLIDDAIRDILKDLNPLASLVFISDSCFSGTVTRAFLSTLRETNPPMPRFLPPTDGALPRLGTELKKRVFYPEENMKELLISGCSDTEYSYDAKFGGVPQGAFTYYAGKVIKENPQLTYANFYAKLRTYLPSGQYSQTPKLEGSTANKNKVLFT